MGNLFVPSSGISILDESNIGVSVTGVNTETTLATTTLPILQPNDVLRITSLWSTPGGGANNKTMRIRLGGVSGTQYMNKISTTQLSLWEIHTIANRNSVSSQVGRATGADIGASSGATTTSAIDTSVSTTIVFSGQVANTSDTITLESYMVELLRR